MYLSSCLQYVPLARVRTLECCWGKNADIVAHGLAAPLERVKMEMQLKQKQNAIKVARELATDGYLSFWKGNGMNLLRVTPHKVIQAVCTDHDIVGDSEVRKSFPEGPVEPGSRVPLEHWNALAER